MKDLSFLFGEFVDSQRDMFEEMTTLVSDNPDVFKGTIGYTESRGTSYVIESGMRENIYFRIKVQTKEPQVTVVFKANNPNFFQPLVKKLQSNLSDTYELDSTSNKNEVSFSTTIEDALELWSAFVGK